jgi:hypothetical protein
VSSPSRHKTSLKIDTAKVEAAKDALGTSTLASTVDAALTEVIKLRQRLVELLFSPDALGLSDPETMADAWHRTR